MNTVIKLLIGILLISPIVYLATIWTGLPEQVPMHYNINGIANRYGSKKELWTLTGVMSFINILVYFILTNIHRIDPKRSYSKDTAKKLKFFALAIALFNSSLIISIIYQISSGGNFLTDKYMFIGVGVLFAIIGNYMYNIKPNYFIGFRLPSTLKDENNWKATHRLAAPLWFVGGLLLTLISLCFPVKTILYCMGVIVIFISAIPIIYSLYLQYQVNKRA